MPNGVLIRKLKFDGTVRRTWEADLVDGDGAWLVAHADAARHGATKDGRPTDAAAHSVFFLATARPLTVVFEFDALGRFLGARADAAFPAAIDGRTLSFTDLDLDLMLEPSGNVYARDFDDLAANGAAMAYSREAIDTAWAGLRLASELWADHAYPFDGSAERCLGMVLAAAQPL